MPFGSRGVMVRLPSWLKFVGFAAVAIAVVALFVGIVYVGQKAEQEAALAERRERCLAGYENPAAVDPEEYRWCEQYLLDRFIEAGLEHKIRNQRYEDQRYRSWVDDCVLARNPGETPRPTRSPFDDSDCDVPAPKSVTPAPPSMTEPVVDDECWVAELAMTCLAAAEWFEEQGSVLDRDIQELNLAD